MFISISKRERFPLIISVSDSNVSRHPSFMLIMINGLENSKNHTHCTVTFTFQNWKKCFKHSIHSNKIVLKYVNYFILALKVPHFTEYLNSIVFVFSCFYIPICISISICIWLATWNFRTAKKIKRHFFSVQLFGYGFYAKIKF